MHRGLGLGLIGALFLAAPPAVVANEKISIGNEGRRINLAGRQRMLSQRIAKSACLSLQNVKRDHHLKQLSAAAALFAETLDGLYGGSTSQKLAPATDATVKKQLEIVQGLWSGYDMEIQNFIKSPELPSGLGAMTDLARKSIPILNEMDYAVALMENVGKTRAYDPGLANAINVSGRQRMLSQRMTKEYCLIYAGIDRAVNYAFIRGTVALFNSSKLELLSGLSSLKLDAPQRRALIEEYETVTRIWTRFSGPILQAVNGGAPTLEGLKRVATENEPLLKSLNRIVYLYER